MTTEIKKTEKELLDHVADLEIQIKKLKDRKRYGLVWEEKIEKFDKESKEALPILIEKGNKYSDIVTDKDKDFNILIEGDNYHSLSILSYTHKNKIDVIYIDPPYNTGNKDFIYNDHFVDKEDGFRHSKWLSFLNKRLKIAKNLLTKDGVIFISIDDNEQANLKLLCDSVFGENSFVALFPWKKRTTKSDVPFGVSQDYEWVICYAKSSFLAGMSHERKYYKTDDYPNDRWRLSDLTTQKVEKDRPNSAFNLVNPKNGKIYPYNPNRLWAITKDTFEDYYKKGKIVFPEDYDFLKISIPSYRVFESEDKKKALKKYGSDTALKSVSTHFPKDIGMNEDGNEEITNLFGEKIFSYPKPKNLIKYLLDISTNSNSLILDFMAGSGTTGHAVLELNKDDGGSRRFILCTNNGDEKSEHKIAEDICYPRLKKIIKGYIDINKEKIEGFGGNLKYLKTDFVKLEKSIDSLKHKIVEGSTEIICLKEGSFNTVLDDYNKNKIKIFKSTTRYTAILFDLFYFENFIAELRKLKDKPVSVYIFSYAKDFSKEEFGNLGIKFTVEAIPEKILETYKKIFNF